MSRRKIENPEMLLKLWDQYKRKCNNKKVLVHDFSSQNSEFVSKELLRSVTYTIEGFCLFVGISRQGFYKGYTKNSKFCDIVTRMKEECEVDARSKFELQIIPSRFAPLWMSTYGYSTKEKTVVASDSISNILDALNGKAESVFSEPEEND